MVRFIIAAVIFLFSFQNALAQGQTSVHSINGYDVKITISNMVLNKYPYPWNANGGCTYTITLNYKIQFVGNNVPASMWTLQGYVRCNQSSYFDLPNEGGSGTVTSATASYNGNPSALTLSSLCKTFDLEIMGPGISYRLITLPIGGPLPIELLDFSAKANDQQVDLNWSTGSERNNDFFTIEKTIDGINYETVGTINGAGNSSSQNEYTFTDYNPAAGTSYYRLKQTDSNGDFEYFEPVAVEIEKANVVSNVYPNPATESRVNITVSQTQTPVEVNLYNLMGQLVSTQTIDATTGNITQVIELPETGNTFFVELIQNNELAGRHKILTAR